MMWVKNFYIVDNPLTINSVIHHETQELRKELGNNFQLLRKVCLQPHPFILLKKGKLVRGKIYIIFKLNHRRIFFVFENFLWLHTHTHKIKIFQFILLLNSDVWKISFVNTPNGIILHINSYKLISFLYTLFWLLNLIKHFQRMNIFCYSTINYDFQLNSFFLFFFLFHCYQTTERIIKELIWKASNV